MPTLPRLQVPPPKDWAEFEEVTLTALRIRWSSPNLERNGRQGQPQAGVDIFGPDHMELPVGVQCKQTDGELTLKTVKAEVTKAEGFKPGLAMFYIATTAKPDTKLQAAVRSYSRSRVANGKFAVGLIYWDSLLGDLAANPAEFRKHFPQLTVHDSHGATGQRMLALLDAAYLGHFVREYLRLLFGEFGRMTDDSLGEFDRVVFALRGAAPVLYETDQAQEVDQACRRLLAATNSAYEGKAEWDEANDLAVRLKAITEQLEYRLDKDELSVFTLGRMLGRWGFMETENVGLLPRDRDTLVTLLKATFGGALPDTIVSQFSKYDADPEAIRAGRVPDRIFQHLRQAVLLKELGIDRVATAVEHADTKTPRRPPAAAKAESAGRARLRRK